MIFALTQNGIVTSIGTANELFPGTSFSADGPNEQFMSENGMLPVTDWLPHDGDTEKLVTCAPCIHEGQVVRVRIAPLNSSELQQRAEELAAEVRARRNQLLAKSDWTQLLDAATDREAWAAYREALRGVPEQPGFPRDVHWPTPPDQAPVRARNSDGTYVGDNPATLGVNEAWITPTLTP